VKFAEPRRYADPAAAARRLLEIASTVEPVHGYRNRDRSRGVYFGGCKPGEEIHWSISAAVSA